MSPEKSTREIFSLPTSEIYADEDFNCRGHIDKLECKGLAESMAKTGLKSPIEVEPYNKDGYKYRILTGHRRFVAAGINKWESIDAFIIKGLSELDRITHNFEENVQREDLSFEQEAATVLKFMRYGLTDRAISDRVHMGLSWTQVRIYFNKLPPDAQRVIVESKVSQAEIKKIYTLYSKAKLKDDGTRDLTEFYAQIRRMQGDNSPRTHDVDPNTRRHRNKSELTAMSDHIRTRGAGPCVLTALLSWAAGDVTNEKLDRVLETWHIENGHDYDRRFPD